MKVDGVWLRRFAHLGARYGPAPLLDHAPRVLGSAFALLLARHREQIRQNLRQVLGPRDRLTEHRAIERTFVNFARCLAESLATGRRQSTQAQIAIDGVERFDQVLAEGGAVLVTAHVGPFEAAAHHLARARPVDLMMVMAPEQDERAREYHDGLRARLGIRIAHVGNHATDAIGVLSHLRRGGVAALQLDRLPTEGRRLGPQLFGREYLLPEGPFQLAALAGVPLLAVFAFRRGPFDYTLTVGEPISLSRRPDEPELQWAAARVAEEMERAILRDPTQWFHFDLPHAGLKPSAT